MIQPGINAAADEPNIKIRKIQNVLSFEFLVKGFWLSIAATLVGE